MEEHYVKKGEGKREKMRPAVVETHQLCFVTQRHNFMNASHENSSFACSSDCPSIIH